MNIRKPPHPFEGSYAYCSNFDCECDDPDVSDLLSLVKGPVFFPCLKKGFDGGRYNCELREPVLDSHLGEHVQLKCSGGVLLHADFSAGIRFQYAVFWISYFVFLAILTILFIKYRILHREVQKQQVMSKQ